MKKIRFIKAAVVTALFVFGLTGCPYNSRTDYIKTLLNTNTELKAQMEKAYGGTFTWTGNLKEDYGIYGCTEYSNLSEAVNCRTYTFTSSVLVEKGINDGIVTVVTSYNSLCSSGYVENYSNYESLIYGDAVIAKAKTNITSAVGSDNLTDGEIMCKPFNYFTAIGSSDDSDSFAQNYYDEVRSMVLYNKSAYTDSETKTYCDAAKKFSEKHDYTLSNTIMIFYTGTDSTDTIQKVIEEKDKSITESDTTTGFDYIYNKKYASPVSSKITRVYPYYSFNFDF